MAAISAGDLYKPPGMASSRVFPLFPKLPVGRTNQGGADFEGGESPIRESSLSGLTQFVQVGPVPNCLTTHSMAHSISRTWTGESGVGVAVTPGWLGSRCCRGQDTEPSPRPWSKWVAIAACVGGWVGGWVRGWP